MMDFNFNIQFNKDSQWHMKGNHFHEGFEILFTLTDAEGSFFIEDKLYPIKKGTLLLINNAVLHHSIVDSDTVYSRYVLHFSNDTLSKISSSQTDFLKKLNSLSQHSVLSGNDLSILTSYFEICNKVEPQSFGNDIKRKIAFINILLFVIEELENHESSTLSMPTNFVKVMPILEYIQSNITEELTLDEISEQFFISKYHLCHIFKEATGFTVNNYIINYRILKSRELLRQGETVQATAEKSGFKSYSHFIRTFTKLTNISPGQYMKNYRNAIK